MGIRLIDADALYETISDHVTTVSVCPTVDWARGKAEMKEICLEDIQNAPTIERRGRWIKMTGMMPPEYHGHYECSECQWHMKGPRNSWTREEELSYCPQCGAQMDGGNGDG